MPLNFAFDGGATFTYQPSQIEVTPVEAETVQGVNGGYVAIGRSKGTEIRVTWGVDVAVTAAMAALRTARNSTIAHTIQFTDPSSTNHSYKVLWLSDPPFSLGPEYLYERFSITFYERPD